MGGACGTYGRNAYRVLVGKPERTDYLGDIGIDGRTVLSSSKI